MFISCDNKENEIEDKYPCIYKRKSGVSTSGIV